jgi:hypothetical protein
MRQESHRIHWQQWGKDPQSKRDLITRSASVRLTDAATANDVIQLLGENLDLVGIGALILVGTLYNMPSVKFDHEQGEGALGESGKPVYFVRTLKCEENPLQVRDLMQKVLEKRQQESPQIKSPSSMIAPKLQWYFIPEDPASQIPKCLELDGYSTTMEEEDFEYDDEEEDNGYDHVEPVYQDPTDTPWTVKDEHKHAGALMIGHDESAQKQMQRAQQLALHHTTLDHYVISGYLWKQSHIDPHVWRKVHCVLTEDHFWFVTRIKQWTKHGPSAAYYSRLALSRALVVESSPSLPVTSILSRVPFSWEVVSATGRSHFFRAVSHLLQQRWTSCLKDRILQSQENKLFQQAELIVADETAARTKRLTRLIEASGNRNVALIQWTLKVFDYREQCRHIKHRLPTKTLIVTKSSSVQASQEPPLTVEMPELDDDLQVMVRDAWDLAAKLLLEATTKLKHVKGHNVETLCRHIDYILTGRMRPLSEAGTPLEEKLVDRSRDPPPSNLFDGLLAEFQEKVNDSN